MPKKKQTKKSPKTTKKQLKSTKPIKLIIPIVLVVMLLASSVGFYFVPVNKANTFIKDEENYRRSFVTAIENIAKVSEYTMYTDPELSEYDYQKQLNNANEAIKASRSEISKYAELIHDYHPLESTRFNQKVKDAVEVRNDRAFIVNDVGLAATQFINVHSYYNQIRKLESKYKPQLENLIIDYTNAVADQDLVAAVQSLQDFEKVGQSFVADMSAAEPPPELQDYKKLAIKVNNDAIDRIVELRRSLKIIDDLSDVALLAKFSNQFEEIDKLGQEFAKVWINEYKFKDKFSAYLQKTESI